MQAAEGGRRLFDAEAGLELRSLRSVGGDVAFDVCLQTSNTVTDSDVFHRAGA